MTLTTRIPPYYVAVCQAKRIATRSEGLKKFKENIQTNLNRYCALIDYCCAGGAAASGRESYAIVGPVKLVTFGEYAITGPYAPANPTDHRFNNREAIEHLAIRIPGPETDVLAAKARQHKVYVAAVNIEFDPEWPNTHFNTGFIINPEGKIILKYRKTLTNNPIEIACSAHDIMAKYKNPITKKYDPFPVVDTAIGRLALMICADLGSTEIPKVYSLKGAEVVMHLTAGNAHSAGGPRPIGITEAVKRVRAFDNCIYFVNSNWGPQEGAMYPEAGIAGYSAVVDYTGLELAKSEDSGEQVVRAKIDIEALRAHRARFYGNPLTMTRTELFAPYYNRSIYPPNTFLEDGPIEATLDERQRKFFSKAVENIRKFEDFYSENNV